MSFRVANKKYSSASEHEGLQDVDYGDYSLILHPEHRIRGVKHIPRRSAPTHINCPHYASDPKRNTHAGSDTQQEAIISLGSEDETRLRRAAKLAAATLKFAAGLIRPGITTEAIDERLHWFIVENNAYPSPLNYLGFPKSCCTSVNNIVAHGIPDDREVEPGDIINVDVTVYLDGYHGDTSRTFLVEDVDDQGKELVGVTQEALELAIGICGPDVPFKRIGEYIDKFVRAREMSVVRALTGHGIGREFHCRPWIVHHGNEEPGVMKLGHCFTIEPAIIQGSNPSVWEFLDGWTVATESGARSAQAEHMVLITENGAEVLTR
ncbi:methionyl aminopeptidase [Sistotremastrum niveocremeum HHB9708]|uniref:Methionine aminopeptidase n=1 Tax=Sistotremastrum niveocremeum HHB9708 TaxID=1314777 RepID=A0A164SCV7_9AGAM|nr:methionyl aminopeptidase [Sistotremastrum niveocremeum HHB9708]